MPGPLIVTDHALVRYLERVMNFDLEAVRRQIEKAVKPLGHGTGKRRISAGGFTFVLKNDYVTTVLEQPLRKGTEAHYRNGKDAR